MKYMMLAKAITEVRATSLYLRRNSAPMNKGIVRRPIMDMVVFVVSFFRPFFHRTRKMKEASVRPTMWRGSTLMSVYQYR